MNDPTLVFLLSTRHAIHSRLELEEQLQRRASMRAGVDAVNGLESKPPATPEDEPKRRGLFRLLGLING